MDIINIIKEHNIVSGNINITVTDGVPLRVDIEKMVYRREKRSKDKVSSHKKL